MPKIDLKANIVNADGIISYIFKTKIKNIFVWIGITYPSIYIENGLTCDTEYINEHVPEYLLTQKEYEKYNFVLKNIYKK